MQSGLSKRKEIGEKTNNIFSQSLNKLNTAFLDIMGKNRPFIRYVVNLSFYKTTELIGAEDSRIVSRVKVPIKMSSFYVIKQESSKKKNYSHF